MRELKLSALALSRDGYIIALKRFRGPVFRLSMHSCSMTASAAGNAVFINKVLSTKIIIFVRVSVVKSAVNEIRSI